MGAVGDPVRDKREPDSQIAQPVIIERQIGGDMDNPHHTYQDRDDARHVEDRLTLWLLWRIGHRVFPCLAAAL